MKFDRHEKHVLNELHELGLPTNKLIGLANGHRIAVAYEFSHDKRLTECYIILDHGISYHGNSYASRKEDKISEPVGRMIAFTYAVLMFMSRVYPDKFYGIPDSFDAENIARGATQK